MTDQNTVLTKKRRGRAPTGKGTLAGVRLQPADLELLDLWIEANEEGITRPEAMRRMLHLAAMRIPK